MRLIVCMGLAGGGGDPLLVGQYLKSYDPEFMDGRGTAEWTDDLAQAMRFGSAIEAFTFWKQQAKLRPLRDDGKPNRPLTAFSITTLSEDQVGDEHHLTLIKAARKFITDG